MYTHTNTCIYIYVYIYIYIYTCVSGLYRVATGGMVGHNELKDALSEGTNVRDHQKMDHSLAISDLNFKHRWLR